LVTPVSLQRKRHRLALKRQRSEKNKTEAAEYAKVVAQRNKEQREKRQQSISKKRQQSKNTAQEKKAAPDKKDEDKSVNISRLDIRVGRIVQVEKHKEADSLYVEQIDVGEAKPRTIVSGLVKFVPIEQMQNRLVLVVCNMKPAKLRGIMSEGMVLAASNADHSQVELLDPAPGSKPGERVVFEGHPGEPDAQLNPKQKIFEQVQPDFMTTDDCTAVWKGIPFRTSVGIIKVKSIKKGSIK